MESTYWVWDMHREILHIAGPLAIRWYSLCFMLGFVVGYQFFTKMLQYEHKPIALRDAVLYYIVAGTIIGARLGHCLFYDPMFYLTHPLDILKVWTGGLSSHGGFTGVILAVYLFSRQYSQLGFWWLIDRISLVSVLAGGFIRIGNFFNSEVIGKPFDGPWAVIFAQVDPLPRHPTQLYEAFGYMLISLSLIGLYYRHQGKLQSGKLFGLCLMISYGFRFCIEFLKENQVPFENQWPINMGQWLSLPFILLGGLLAFGVFQKNCKKYFAFAG